ncbi:hypothetical protein EIP86_005120 [Pleurotus ostreatoroseus]|nr:hypothetical protein EIP86_005120 [Pleurotus ostreatoroseus]
MIHHTFKQLRELVREMAGAMRASGLQAGDRVSAIVSNTVDAIVISLAAGSIGAIYSSSSTDMGAQVRISLQSLHFDSIGSEK